MLCHHGGCTATFVFLVVYLIAIASNLQYNTDMKDTVLAYLDEHNIPYQLIHHPVVVTAEQSSAIIHVDNCIGCKSLYVKDKKSDNCYMIVLPFSMRADMRGLASVVGCAKFEFATAERLLANMGVTRGSVSPYAYLYDSSIASRVPLIIDSSVLASPLVKFHPCDNSCTVVTKSQDFSKYLDSIGVVVHVV